RRADVLYSSLIGTREHETEVSQERLQQEERSIRAYLSGWAGARLTGSFGPSELLTQKEQGNARIFTLTKNDCGIFGDVLVGFRRLWKCCLSCRLSQRWHRAAWRLVCFWSFSADDGLCDGPCFRRALQPGGNRRTVYGAAVSRKGRYPLCVGTGCWSDCRRWNSLCHCKWEGRL